MATVRLKHVNSFRDRRGKLRHYYRKPGCKAVSLPGVPGSPAFMDAYNAAVAGTVSLPKKGIGSPKEGTVAALRLLFYAHPSFTKRKPATQRSLRSYIDRLAAEEGDKPVARMEPKNVQDRVDLFADAGKAAAARNFLIAVRALMKLAIKKEWRKDDPTIGVELPKIRGKGYRTWTDQHAAVYEAAYPPGTRGRFVYEAYACTGLRGSDIARLGRQHIRPRKKIAFIGGSHKVTHNLVLDMEKTGERIVLPVLPRFQAAIDALPAGNMSFLVTPDGKPLSAKRTRDLIREYCLAIGLTPEVCDDSGRPKGLSGHGLRKRMAKRLADECGCSEPKIAAVLGHKDLRQVRTYTQAANKDRMAEEALFELLGLDEEERPRTTDLQTTGTDLQTVSQPTENKGE
jgi:integrase